MSRACAACLRRTQLLSDLSPALEQRFRRDRPVGVLTLDDEQLVHAVVGRDRHGTPITRRSDGELLARAVDDQQRHGVTAICQHDPAYPARLLDLPDRPAVLHVLGGLSRLEAVLGRDGTRPTVAIVGARKAPAEACLVARRFSESLAAAGVTVVSGMAFGVDAAAHEGALAGWEAGAASGAGAPGNTIAVLAGGVERASPVSHRRLHQRIARDGVVVGEMAPGTTPRPWGFPARNRLIAALGDAVVIVGAAQRSGSLGTATIALDLHRPLGVVPGPVLTPAFAGSNGLLRQGEGAQIVLEPDDIRELLGERSGHQALDPIALSDPLAGLTGPARVIAERLTDGPRTIEQLLEGADSSVVLAALAGLEADGRLRRSLSGELSLIPASLGA